MSDLSWCPSCDNAISPFSDSLYCSEECLRDDAIRRHPLLGYNYPELSDFPRPLSKRPSFNSIYSSCSNNESSTTTTTVVTQLTSSSSSIHSNRSSIPSLVKSCIS
ncbi:uncharacterized protein BX664DRAFT_325537 [Halteromyces radiatus]|uniref:uncharacterized protein n=1 Tax=Halteromyces radiatus TaxID=101107 RepID=UPI00222106E0|nr:uncharacterized protein BX664DRAFT_325537 [Halteromyces radiatus]KAI8097084.1 hypothetical protein BX664DRAFT_325537 [Halteromyces radiatus]